MKDAMIESPSRQGNQPAPAATYDKSGYRVTEDAGFYQVESWGPVSRTWSLKTKYPVSEYRLKEESTRFCLYKRTPGDDANDKPLMDSQAVATKLRDDAFAIGVHLRAMNVRNRLMHGKPAKGAC